MSKDVSFSLDLKGGEEILTTMIAPTLKRSAEAIAARARSMASSISSNPPDITVTESVGVVQRGTRAIATVRAVGDDDHANYVGYQALARSKDAGRTN